MKEKKSIKKKVTKKPKGKYHHGNLKDTLLECTLQQLKKTGSKEFSLRDISARAGVSHTSIYRHFPSKMLLLAALAEKGFLLFKDALDQATQLHPNNPEKQLLEQAMTYAKFAVDHPIYYHVMFTERINPKKSPPSLHLAAKEAFLCLLNVVIEGSKKGIFINKSPEEIAIAIWAKNHGLALLLINQMLEDSFQLGAKQASQIAKRVSQIMHDGVLLRKK